MRHVSRKNLLTDASPNATRANHRSDARYNQANLSQEVVRRAHFGVRNPQDVVPWFCWCARAIDGCLSYRYNRLQLPLRLDSWTNTPTTPDLLKRSI